MRASTSVISAPGHRCCMSGNRSAEYMSSIQFVILKFNKRAHIKFTVCGRKQASKHTHARAQCSPASVGLAQARPNKLEQAQFFAASTGNVLSLEVTNLTNSAKICFELGFRRWSNCALLRIHCPGAVSKYDW